MTTNNTDMNDANMNTGINNIGFEEKSVKQEDLHEKVKQIMHEGGYLLGIAAVDSEGKSKCRFAIKYFFISESEPGMVKAISVCADENFPSVSNICPSAKLYEREIMDMFGLLPLNHPDLKPLMLYPENWDGSVHPLRKDYNNVKPEFKSYGEYKYKKVYGGGVFEIPVGPIHAGIIEPGHFRFSLRGEPVLQLEIRHFWKHRGIEKLLEGKSLEEALKIVSRISGDNSVNITLAYLTAAERIRGIEIPLRAKNIRVILSELERVWNHVRDIGFIFMDMGYNLEAQKLFIVQEDLLRLNKKITSHRYMFDALCVGGLNDVFDINAEKAKVIAYMLKETEEKVKNAERVILNSPSVTDRIELAGKISKKTAAELSLCGVCARGSGLQRDTRAEIPYLLYNETVKIKPKIFQEGDVLARTKVRIQEILESVNIITGLCGSLNESGSDLKTAGEAITAAGAGGLVSAIGNAETPRGNAFFYISATEDGKIYRLKYIDPSFRNWPAIQYGILGDIIADFPLVNKSMNLSYAGNDL